MVSRSDGPWTMPTDQLQTKIDKAILMLCHLFDISEEQLGTFPKPALRRELKHDENPEHNRGCQGYENLKNFFYFPLEDWHHPKTVFTLGGITHEVGHYLHRFVNGNFPAWNQQFSETGSYPKGHGRLSELVAEYGVMILNLNDYTNWFVKGVYRKELTVFQKQGPDLLPCLARMSVDEARLEGFIE